MRREGRVRGEPSSKSRSRGNHSCRKFKGRSCRSNNHHCRDFIPDHPGEKSWAKRKHRVKRFAGDVATNPALADFRLHFAHLPLSRWCEPGCSICDAEEEEERRQPPGDLGPATVNSLIKAALAGDEDSAAVADDIAAIDLACEKFLRILVSESFSEYATPGWSPLSEESWSDVELLGSSENSEPDDWSMVDFDEDEGSCE